ncbi:hypothetical protein C4D60_Mb05t30960 [Musa balbisiana]|uniref:Isopenicillin N synthase-like Fe(2+) 2OG dioxygenase domain-containing protein n=1 Tax=Musa balbisiana TaxID=52838 RepID=A0A4S8K022_MUSBA|nr:hypothetical protein C4D60_Mb05t30960 [Musa balbisiana]
MVKLCGTLMKVLSISLGLDVDQLQAAFGGDDVGACLRVNYYPRCPQPELTLGLSPHSDPGGLTVLLADDCVKGLQRPPLYQATTFDEYRMHVRKNGPTGKTQRKVNNESRITLTSINSGMFLNKDKAHQAFWLAHYPWRHLRPDYFPLLRSASSRNMENNSFLRTPLSILLHRRKSPSKV